MIHQVAQGDVVRLAEWISNLRFTEVCIRRLIHVEFPGFRQSLNCSCGERLGDRCDRVSCMGIRSFPSLFVSPSKTFGKEYGSILHDGDGETGVFGILELSFDPSRDLIEIRFCLTRLDRLKEVIAETTDGNGDAERAYAFYSLNKLDEALEVTFLFSGDSIRIILAE